jgi:hypothetical protein
MAHDIRIRERVRSSLITGGISSEGESDVLSLHSSFCFFHYSLSGFFHFSISRFSLLLQLLILLLIESNKRERSERTKSCKRERSQRERSERGKRERMKSQREREK